MVGARQHAMWTPLIAAALTFVVYGATPLGEALCCDVTLVSPLTREKRPQPSASTPDGAAITVPERRKRVAYPALLRTGPQRLCVLPSPVKLEAIGALSRYASSLFSCASEHGELLPPCTLRLGRVGCAAGGAS